MCPLRKRTEFENDARDAPEQKDERIAHLVHDLSSLNI
jgi:hypothetical protein